MLNELYTFAEPVQVVPFSNLKWGKFTLLHTGGTVAPQGHANLFEWMNAQVLTAPEITNPRW